MDGQNDGERETKCILSGYYKLSAGARGGNEANAEISVKIGAEKAIKGRRTSRRKKKRQKHVQG